MTATRSDGQQPCSWPDTLMCACPATVDRDGRLTCAHGVTAAGSDGQQEREAIAVGDRVRVLATGATVTVTAIGANMWTERVVIETVGTDDVGETGAFYDLDEIEAAS